MKKTSFLYWNTENKANIEPLLSIQLSESECDILILAETRIPLSEAFCKNHNFMELELHASEKERLSIRVYYSKTSSITLNHLNNIQDEEAKEIVVEEKLFDALILRRIKKIARVINLELKVNSTSYLLSCIHFPSKKNQDDISQLHTAFNYKRYILERATEFENRTIIVGDFNMNPFDYAMVEPHGFFALNSKDFVLEKRLVQHSLEIMFYNPCWWLLGDYHPAKRLQKVSGSHYYSGANSKKLFWHLFDQVIISKCMIEKFNHEDLEIVEIKEVMDEVTDVSSRKQARFPDHLPIKFSFGL